MQRTTPVRPRLEDGLGWQGLGQPEFTTLLPPRVQAWPAERHPPGVRTGELRARARATPGVLWRPVLRDSAGLLGNVPAPYRVWRRRPRGSGMGRAAHGLVCRVALRRAVHPARRG